MEQEIYKECQSFGDSLRVSHESQLILLNEIRKCKGIGIRNMDDKKAFEFVDGRMVRFWDVEALVNSKVNHIEFKDFSQAHCYNATGVPKIYFDRIMSASKDPLFFIFKDSVTTLIGRKERAIRANVQWDIKRYTSDDNVVKETPFVEGTFKQPIFHFYGHRADYLMEKCRHTRAEEVCGCEFLGQYKGQKQYMWKTNMMLPLDVILDCLVKEIEFPFSHPLQKRVL